MIGEFHTSLHRYCGLAVFLSIACRLVIDANSNWHARVLLSMFQSERAAASSQRGVTHKRR
jgi:DNA-binding GntR family transcriptional regulator